MKKILFILLLLLLTSCGTKRSSFYELKYNDSSVVVGCDNISIVENDEYIDSYSYYLNKNDEPILSKLVLYVDDLDNKNIYIDNHLLNEGIKETCASLKGELIDHNGYACLINKTVNKRENYILIYGDILADDINKINRIEVYYDVDNGQ